MNQLDDRGQTAMEYLLLIGAGILVAIMVFVFVKNYLLTPTLATAGNETDAYKNLTNASG